MFLYSIKGAKLAKFNMEAHLFTESSYFGDKIIKRASTEEASAYHLSK